MHTLRNTSEYTNLLKPGIYAYAGGQWINVKKLNA